MCPSIHLRRGVAGDRDGMFHLMLRLQFGWDTGSVSTRLMMVCEYWICQHVTASLKSCKPLKFVVMTCIWRNWQVCQSKEGCIINGNLSCAITCDNQNILCLKSILLALEFLSKVLLQALPSQLDPQPWSTTCCKVFVTQQDQPIATTACYAQTHQDQAALQSTVWLDVSSIATSAAKVARPSSPETHYVIHSDLYEPVHSNLNLLGAPDQLWPCRENLELRRHHHQVRPYKADHRVPVGFRGWGQAI